MSQIFKSISVLFLILASVRTGNIKAPSLRSCLIISYTPENNTQAARRWWHTISSTAFLNEIPIINFSHRSSKRTERFLAGPCKIFILYVTPKQQTCVSFLRTKLPLLSSVWNEEDTLIIVNQKEERCNTQKGLKEKDFTAKNPIKFFPQNVYVFIVKLNQPSMYVSEEVQVRIVYSFKYFCPGKITCFLKTFDSNKVGSDESTSFWYHLENLSQKQRTFDGWSVRVKASDTDLTENDLLDVQLSTILDMRLSRRLHLREATSVPLLKVCLELGSKLNFTPVITHKEDTKLAHKRSAIKPGMLMKYSGREFNGKRSRIQSQYQSFVYCENMTTQANVNAFAFVEPFGAGIWSCIVLTVLILIPVFKLAFRIPLNQVIVAIISPLVLQILPLHHRHAHLIVPLWSCLCLILASAYLSKFESLLIAPPLEQRIETFEQLTQNGYRIALRGTESRAYWMMCASSKKGSFNGLDYLKKLRKEAEVVTDKHLPYMRYIATTPKRATMNLDEKLDNYAPVIATLYPHIQCFKGKEKLFTYGSYWVYEQPYAQWMKDAFDRILESGAYGVLANIRLSWLTRIDRMKWDPLFKKLKLNETKQEGMVKITEFSLSNQQAWIFIYIFLCSLAISLVFLVGESLYQSQLRFRLFIQRIIIAYELLTHSLHMQSMDSIV